MMGSHHGEDAVGEVEAAADACFVWSVAVEAGVRAWLVLRELSLSVPTRLCEARD